MNSMRVAGVLAAAVVCGVAASPVQAQILEGHYTFSNFSDLGADSSGNGNNASSIFSVGTLTAAAGPGGAATSAVQFAGSSYFNWLGASNPIVSVLAGSFSFSVWVKTTAVGPGAGGPGYDGLGIIYADVSSFANDTIPLALNGSNATFFTGSEAESVQTLTSNTVINSGDWTHIVITRDFVTGGKSIYINGALDIFVVDSGTAGVNLSALGALILGANVLDVNFYYGTLADFQVYSGELSPDDAAFLYANPGLVVPEPSIAGLLLGAAAAATVWCRRIRRRAT